MARSRAVFCAKWAAGSGSSRRRSRKCSSGFSRGGCHFAPPVFFRHTESAGVDSVPLVGLVSFFLGLTMALLTGYQLQRFGTERLIPGLVAIAFTRELGPLLTGIMLAARIGAAFTAELGTMQVSE